MWSLVAEAVVDGWSQPLYIPLADLAVGWALVASGLVGMIRRPGQVAGGRLVIAGFLWWVGNFVGSADPRIAILGFAFQGYHDVVLALLVLSFPARWPTRRIDTALVIGLAVVFAVNSVVRLAVRVPGELLGLDVIDQATSFSLIAVPDLLRGVALLVVAVGIMGRLFSSRGAFRRLVTPVLLAGAAWSGAASLNTGYVPLVVLGVIDPLPDDVYVPLAWSLNVVRIAVPIAIYVGIVRLRRERSAVADVIVEIAEAPTRPASRRRCAARWMILRCACCRGTPRRRRTSIRSASRSMRPGRPNPVAPSPSWPTRARRSRPSSTMPRWSRSRDCSRRSWRRSG